MLREQSGWIFLCFFWDGKLPEDLGKSCQHGQHIFFLSCFQGLNRKQFKNTATSRHWCAAALQLPILPHCPSSCANCHCTLGSIGRLFQKLTSNPICLDLSCFCWFLCRLRSGPWPLDWRGCCWPCQWMTPCSSWEPEGQRLHDRCSNSLLGAGKTWENMGKFSRKLTPHKIPKLFKNVYVRHGDGRMDFWWLVFVCDFSQILGIMH